VPATGHQIYLAEGADIHILTFLVPDAAYQDYRAMFDEIGTSFRRTK
jgi:hypothetical protein